MSVGVSDSVTVSCSVDRQITDVIVLCDETVVLVLVHVRVPVLTRPLMLVDGGVRSAVSSRAPPVMSTFVVNADKPSPVGARLLSFYEEFA